MTWGDRLRKYVLISGLSIAGILAPSFLDLPQTQVCAQGKSEQKQETKTLDQVLSVEIKRLTEKEDKTVEDYIRLIDLYDNSNLPKDEKKEKILKITQENKDNSPGANYLKAFELKLKEDFEKAKDIFREVSKNPSLDKRIKSNALLRNLELRKDVNEKEILSVLDIDETNLLTYSKLIEYKFNNQIKGKFRKDNSILSFSKSNKKLDDLVKECKKLCDSTIKKADFIQNPTDKFVFKCKTYEKFIDMFIWKNISEIQLTTYEQIAPNRFEVRNASKKDIKNGSRLKFKFAKMIDTYLQKLIELNPSYEKFMQKGQHSWRIRGDKGYNKGIEAFKNAIKIRKTSDAYCSLGQIYRHKARYKYEKNWNENNLRNIQKEGVRKAIDSYEKALMCKDMSEKVKISLPKLITKLKSKLKR